MNRLVRTSELTKLPVVTLAGEAIAQVKDVVYAADGGTVGGFTLAGRGLLAGPLKQGVAWSTLLGVGRDAVVVADEEALEPVKDVVTAASGGGAGGSGGKVLGSQVLTESGVELGTVVDVVLQFDEGRGSGVGPCDVVGYEIEASDALAATSSHGRAKGTKLLVPLPDTLAVSKEHLMVPAGAEGFVTQDLAGFGAAVSAFRAQLQEGRS